MDADSGACEHCIELSDCGRGGFAAWDRTPVCGAVPGIPVQRRVSDDWGGEQQAGEIRCWGEKVRLDFVYSFDCWQKRCWRCHGWRAMCGLQRTGRGLSTGRSWWGSSRRDCGRRTRGTGWASWVGLGRWHVDCVVRMIEMDRIPYSPINNIQKTFEHAQVRFVDDGIVCSDGLF